MPVPVVLAESMAQAAPSASARDNGMSVAAARLAGWQVYEFPQDFVQCGDADAALWHVPEQPRPTAAIWVGFIPSPERYAAVYEAARARNLYLPNSLEQHLEAQEFDRTYLRLGALTPESRVIRSIDEAEATAVALGLPVFVKGAVQSRKAKGVHACVAGTAEELVALTQALLELDNQSRGRVIVRRLLRLRHGRVAAGDFPLGREFRVFVLHGEIAGCGYYWEGEDSLSVMTVEERRVVLELALEAARRLETPYVAVDIGQEEGGWWWVIETGDAQFSGLSQIPPLALWKRLREIAEAAIQNSAGAPI